MKRLIAFGAVLALCAPLGADDKTDVPKELAPFQGEWKVTKLEIDGKLIPPEEYDARFTFKAGKFTGVEKMNGTEQKGTFSVNPKGKLAEIDLVGPDGKQKREGVYKFSGDNLTLCFAEVGNKRPGSFDGGTGRVLMVLEKVKK